MPEESKKQTATWIWVVVGVVVCLAVIGMTIAGGVAYFIFKQTSFETVSAKDAGDRFEKVRSRFTDRTPYIEINKDGDIKIHSELERATESDLKALHILVWDADDDKLVETSIPFWLVKLKTDGPFTIQLDRRHRDLEVKAQNLARRGPGIVVDFEEPGEARVLVWTE